ncbi:complement resistance protein TraT [Thiotrichales bacterium 19S9-12]|nr:complement resistance protein TraT [Thiotrichales bacterium 19S9-11]MCF6812519.1 complement resistance protein TraT [Thiotrichales bacterium 19S9-12]
MTFKKNIKLLAASSAITIGLVQLSGCAAMSTAMNHHSLKTESKMSQSIFLDPVSKNEQTIYVQVKNTTAEDIDLQTSLVSELESRGWEVTDDIDQAHDMVQVNLLQLGEAPNPQTVWSSVNSGFGNALMSGLAGVSTGLAYHSTGVGLSVGGATAAASWITDSLVKDVTYSMITDVQVSVRTDGEVTEVTQSNLSQGASASTKQTLNKKTDWLRYRTRVASIADQMNLDIEDAKPVLAREVSKEIAGIF